MVRIAQISDIHGKPGGKSLAALERALDWLKVVEPDALIVSGDLGNRPWEESYPIVAEQLSHLRYPMLAVPGNVVTARRCARTPSMGWWRTGRSTSRGWWARCGSWARCHGAGRAWRCGRCSTGCEPPRR